MPKEIGSKEIEALKLSVIIPAYNVGRHIADTLGSLLGQTWGGFEIIVVDDGSTDDTLDVVKKILAAAEDRYDPADDRSDPAGKGCESNRLPVCRIISKSNGGVSSARNSGLRVATGDYVCFLDGDDYVSADFAEKISDAIDAWHADIICWKYDIVKEDKTVLSGYSTGKMPGTAAISGVRDGVVPGVAALAGMVVDKSLMIWTGSAAYRREFIMDTGLSYTEGCVSGQDQEFIFKALAGAGKVSFIDATLSFYVMRKGSVTNRCDIGRFDSVQALERVLAYFESLNHPGMDDIISSFKADNMIENYFYVIRSCLKHSEISGISRLLALVDERYPGLNGDMKKIMKTSICDYSNNRNKIRTFLISPVLYQLLMDVKYKRKR